MPGIDISKLLLSLPPWIFWPLAFVSILASLWPGLNQIWMEVVPWRRSYAREKMRLELLKLRYEIEAIKKANQIESIESEQVTSDLKPVLIKEEVLVAESMTFGRRFLFGSLGGLGVAAGGQLMRMLDPFETFDIFVPLRLLISIVIGGFAAAVIQKKKSTPRSSLAVGVASMLLMQALLQGLPSPTPR